MRKLVSILLTLAVAVSLLVVPAAVSAAPGIEFDSVGNGTAGWSTDEAKFGSYSAKLYVADGGVDWAEVSIPVDIAIEDITELKFWEKVDLLGASGWDVNVILGVDCNDNGVFDSDVADWHIGAGQHTAAALAGDSFVEMDGWGGMTSGTFVPPVTYAGLSADVDWREVDVISDVTYGWWTVKADGTGFAYFGSMVGGSFADYLAWLDGTDDDGLIDKGDRVKCVKLVLGGSGLWVDEIAYVDDVTINGETYDFEPNTTVGLTADVEDIVAINVDPTDIDFGTLVPGQTSDVFSITVENIGTHTVDIDVRVSVPSSDLFKNNLEMTNNGNPPWSKPGPWNDLITGLVMGAVDDVQTKLPVPLSYTPSGVETGKLIFEAAAV